MTAAAPTAQRPETGENLKDTIESLVVAFIIAFVFRGFLVEAFVIPTGSMAPTLYGMHGSQICPDCGWEYAYGLPANHPCDKRVTCPNCGRISTHEEMPYHAGGWCNLQKPGRRSRLQSSDLRMANLDFMPQSGDRILVFKWPFDLGGPHLCPEPWDVVVFKNPSNGEDNYIKRLIGVPNEVLEIIRGDIYTLPIDELDDQMLLWFEETVEIKKRMSDEARNPVRANRLNELHNLITEQLNDQLRIRRKTALAQEALWQVVYHHDYRPPNLGISLSHRPHWEPLIDQAAANHWDASTPRIRFSGLGSPRQDLVFTGKQINDEYAYNSGNPSSEREELVGDLRLSLVLNYTEGQGVLGLSLSKHDDVFALELGADGLIVLKHQRIGEDKAPAVVKSTKDESWKEGQLIKIEFGNVDYNVYVKISGHPESVLSTTPDEYKPDIRRLRAHANNRPSEARLYASDLDIELWHVALDRDIYYKNSERRKHRSGWGTQGHPILLRAGEYFVLGDNSPASQDSRLWQVVGPHLKSREDYQLGTVPNDQLIGKAFFVYWPSGHRIRWLPVLRDFGVVPSVGKMRWIR